MSFGVAPAFGAHGYNNPMMPKKDLAREAGRPPAAPVPRAPRAAPKANPNGYLAREASRNNAGSRGSSRGSTPTRSSEQRRPREESPTCYARVSALSRERDLTQNQTFEVGPARTRPESAERTSFRRGHALRQDQAGNAGMPWQKTPPVEPEQPASHPRRSTLRNEQRAADQNLEWASVADTASAVGGASDSGAAEDVSKPPRCYGRKSVLAQEEAVPSGFFGAPTTAANTAADGSAYHGRRNVLRNEIEAQAAPIC